MKTSSPFRSPLYLPMEFPWTLEGHEVRIEPMDAEWGELWDSLTEPQRMRLIAFQWRVFQKELIALGWSPGPPLSAPTKNPHRKKPRRK